MKVIMLCVVALVALVNCANSQPTGAKMTPEATLQLFSQMKSNNELSSEHEGHSDHLNQFESFIREHQRTYETKEEINKRFKIFEENLKMIEELNNSDKGTATFGINKFADRTKEEMKVNFGFNLQGKH